MGEREPLQALLELVENDRLSRLAALEEESRRTAREILASARRSARERVHAALLPERRRLRERLAALDARLATETRLAGQRRLRERLDEAWRELPAALASRWAGAGSRSKWTSHVRSAAADALARGPWHVSHAPGWPEPEREAFARTLESLGVGPVAFEEVPAIAAGLVVRAGGNVVDGSASGLTADRAAIDARLADALGLGEALP